MMGLMILHHSLIMYAQDIEPQALLERYLETGDIESREAIKEQFPESAYHRFCNAHELLNINNRRAKELAEDLIRKYPDFALGYFALGTIYGNGLEQYSTAVIQFNKSIDLDRQFPGSWLNRGMAKTQLKDYQSAREDFSEAINLKREYALAYVLRGVTSYNLKDTDAMLADFEIGLQLDFRTLSKVLDIAGDAVDKAIDLAPENVNYYFARGYAHFVDENYRNALADFTKTVNMISGSSAFFKYAGATKIFLDDPVGAKTDLNIALSINPDDPEIYYYLGILMNEHEDQPAKAYDYFSLAIELDDKNPLYYYQRSKSSFSLMDFPAARDDINHLGFRLT